MDSAAKYTVFHIVQFRAVQYSERVREFVHCRILSMGLCPLFSQVSQFSGSVSNNYSCVNVTMATTATHMADTKLQKKRD